MYELDFITDLVEEQLVKGNLRWLANFNEIRRDYVIEDMTFPVYASGGLQERGFLLSRIFSSLVTPRYRIHFLLHVTPEVNTKSLRKLVLACKNKFGTDDWVFLSIVQSQAFEKSVKDTISGLGEKTIGIAAYSLASKEAITSNNVLGRGLAKQLKLTEAKFEAFDWPNYLKSFTVTFGFGTLVLIVIAFSGVAQAIQPLTLLILAFISIIIGHRIYKTRYHTILTLSSRGFKLKEGQKITEGKWSDYSDVTIFVTPQHETNLRLYTKEETLNLPLSRVGLSRKEAFNAIRQLIRKK